MEYGHGDDLHKYKGVKFKANFSSNVWFDGTHDTLLEYLSKTIPTIANYPAPSAEQLAQNIAVHHKLNDNQIIVTNGATEAFFLITNAFYGSSVTICYPTFSEYENASNVHKLKTVFIDQKSINTHKFTTQLAFICNPNNPDGFEITPNEVARILENNPKTIFLIDEAYIEFSSSAMSSISLLKEYNNLIIIKSLTKLFCIPGLRLGYILTSAKLRKDILNFKMPWNVNTIAMHAGSFIFEHYTRLAPNFSTYFQNAKHLKETIHTLQRFEVIPSNTGYFLIKLKDIDSVELKDALVHQHQILIRDASNFRSLDTSYIRVSSQSESKNQLLINALQKWN